MRRILQRRPVPVGNIAFRLFLASFCSHMSVTLVYALLVTGPLTLGTAAFAAIWSLLGCPLTFISAYHTIFGEKFVSHDLLLQDVVPKEVLVASFVVLVASLAAHRFPLGRFLAYGSATTFTLGGAINYFGWIQQGA